LDEKAKEIDDEFLGISARQEELKKAVAEEKKWIDQQQAEHVELAKSLDKEKKWLDDLAAEQVAKAMAVDAVRTYLLLGAFCQ